MWTMILLLWLIPLALGIVALTRMATGRPPMKRHEWQFFFGKSKQTTLSFWMGLKFAVLAMGFFSAGVIQAVILPNFGTFWILTAPLLTAGGAIVLLLLWLRSGSSPNQMQRKRSLHAQPRDGSIADIFFR